MNLRGKFTSDVDGRIAFRSIKPAGYPIAPLRSRCY
jgi:protocatechuate 3,4-dioxygenase beta subunit